MKILHTADWHLGCKVPILGYERINEQEYILSQIIKTVESENIDTIVIAGDIFDSHLPTVDSEKLLNNFIATVSGDMGKSVIMISGNHDSNEKIKALSILPHKFSKAKFVFFPKGKSIENIIKDKDLIVDLNGITFVCIPFLPFRYLPKSYIGEYSYQDLFVDILNSIMEDIKSDVILISHDTIVGAVYSSNFVSEASESRLDYQALDIDLISRQNFAPKIRYWALGHIHKFQELKGNKVGMTIKAYYSGSILQLNFGEANEDKYILIVDINDQKDEINISPIQINQPKKFIKREIYSNEDGEKLLKEIKDSLGDYYIKTIIKKTISSSMIYSLKEKGIIVEIEHKESEIQNSLKHISNIITDPIQVYKAYCNENHYEYSEEEIQKLDSIMKKIRETST